MKNSIINFKEETSVKSEFEEICKSKATTPSHELRLFVRNYIKRNKASRIPLNQLKNNNKNEN